jgi:hypothetical protein
MIPSGEQRETMDVLNNVHNNLRMFSMLGICFFTLRGEYTEGPSAELVSGG